MPLNPSRFRFIHVSAWIKWLHKERFLSRGFVIFIHQHFPSWNRHVPGAIKLPILDQTLHIYTKCMVIFEGFHFINSCCMMFGARCHIKFGEAHAFSKAPAWRRSQRCATGGWFRNEVVGDSSEGEVKLSDFCNLSRTLLWEKKHYIQRFLC